MEPAGILLASGQSTRLGKPKQLLDWHGEYLINFIIQTILDSPIHDLYVVLGAYKQEIIPVLNNHVEVVENSLWEKGKSESIKAGIRRVSESHHQAVFFSSDQPFISPELISAVIDRANHSDTSIVAASVNGQLTIPVLYKENVYPDLLSLEGDEGGKILFEKYHEDLNFIDWRDERLNLDIDTQSDYEKALNLYDLDC